MGGSTVPKSSIQREGREAEVSDARKKGKAHVSGEEGLQLTVSAGRKRKSRKGGEEERSGKGMPKSLMGRGPQKEGRGEDR